MRDGTGGSALSVAEATWAGGASSGVRPEIGVTVKELCGFKCLA